MEINRSTSHLFGTGHKRFVAEEVNVIFLRGKILCKWNSKFVVLLEGRKHSELKVKWGHQEKCGGMDQEKECRRNIELVHQLCMEKGQSIRNTVVTL